jgi:hypothetical protein
MRPRHQFGSKNRGAIFVGVHHYEDRSIGVIGSLGKSNGALQFSFPDKR